MRLKASPALKGLSNLVIRNNNEQCIRKKSGILLLIKFVNNYFEIMQNALEVMSMHNYTDSSSNNKLINNIITMKKRR